MKKLILLISFLLFFANAYGQKEKIEAAKVAFITEKIELTPDQARQFWPIYNEFSDKKTEIRRQLKQLKTEGQGLSASDEQLKADLAKYFELRQREQELEKDYYNRFGKVITIRQVVALINAERQFTLMLVKRLEEGK